MITRVAELSSFVNSGRVVRKGCSLFILIKNLRGEYNFTEKKVYRWEGLSLKEMNAFGSNTTNTGVSADGVSNTERPMKERTYKYYQDSSLNYFFLMKGIRDYF